MRYVILAAACAALLSPVASDAKRADDDLPKRGERFSCSVTRVYDGDGPIHCAEGPKVRLHGIAAREMNGECRPGHPCPRASAQAAKAALTRMTLGQRLTCEATGKSYQRVVALCWTPAGREVNCAMVEGGYALSWDSYQRVRTICGTLPTARDRRR
jgi:endonuclease YncB( thermonuclease family)